MKSPQLVKELQNRLGEEQFNWVFDKETDKLRLEHKNLGRGMDISLPEILAKYTIENFNQPIGISEYELNKLIPENFKGTLPTIQEIEEELKK